MGRPAILRISDSRRRKAGEDFVLHARVNDVFKPTRVIEVSDGAIVLRVVVGGHAFPVMTETGFVMPASIAEPGALVSLKVHVKKAIDGFKCRIEGETSAEPALPIDVTA